jgi:prepilin-type processing-associated H-X9-DG protein
MVVSVDQPQLQEAPVPTPAPPVRPAPLKRHRRWPRVLAWLVGVPVVLLALVGFLAPSLCRSRETANRVKCASNLRQMGQAIMLYAQSNGGAFPPDLATALRTQDITAEVFCCPSSNAEKALGDTPDAAATALAADPHKHLSYGYVGAGLSLSTPNADEVIVAYDLLDNHDRDGANLLYADGHISWESRDYVLKVTNQSGRPAR